MNDVRCSRFMTSIEPESVPAVACGSQEGVISLHHSLMFVIYVLFLLRKC